jgi:uncharacterized repeat protein (TIGR03803 family)
VNRSLSMFAVALTLMLSAFTIQAGGQTYTKLYTLGTNTNDPINPSFIGLMSQGRDGRLYTTSQFGGANSQHEGTAFAFTTTGTLTRLFDFGNYPAPNSPWSGLTMGTDGNFYGTTTSGGTHISGTVFRVTDTGLSTTLWNFTAGTDEGDPQSAPVLGRDGNFYGTVAGVYAGTYGTAYKITTAGVLKTIHAFAYTDGATPYQLILGLDGFFYGVTRGGGTHNLGVVFRMSTAGAVKVLHTFAGYPTDGGEPLGTLVQGNDGTLYGTTYVGGTKNIGSIYKISPTGTGFAILHNFDRTVDFTQGSGPLSGMALGTDGNLYGTTGTGGTKNAGTLFKITPSGQFTTLYNACSVVCTDGFSPQTPMLQHTNGKFYGLMRGNSLGGGAVYSLNVGLAPFVNLMTTTGAVGSSIQILGQGFIGTSAVNVGGTKASFVVVTDTYITATVPAGTSGFVTVTTTAGTLTSSRKFFVTPTFTSFTPASGAVGSKIVVTGKGLKQASKVTVGGKAATYVVNSDTQVTVTVPVGAVTGKIAITTPGGVATSKTAFTVT